MANKEKQRIGLVLVSGDTALSLRFSRLVGRLATSSDSALFVFSGGLPTKEELKGQQFTSIILFADPLIVTESDVYDLSLFGPVPCILVNFSQGGYSSLVCDLYPATKRLLQHCLDEKMQLAYIQGPANNRLAQQSFQAYRDTLATNNLPLDFRLVSDIGLAELIDQRNLVPAKDFDALYCFGDEEALSLSIQLEERGLTISIVVGSSCGGGSLPSVLLPLASMARSAWVMAHSGNACEEVFDGELSFGNSLAIQDLFSNKQALFSLVVQSYDLDEGDAQTILEFIDACFSLDASMVASMKALITAFLTEGGSLLLLQRLIAGFFLLQEEKQVLFLSLALHGAQTQASLFEKQQSLFARMQKAMEDTSHGISSVLAKHLFSLGITSWYVVQRHMRSQVIAGSVLDQDLSFASGLLPPLLEAQLDEGRWVSLPLGHGSKTGYMLLKTPYCSPNLVLFLKVLFSTLVVSEEAIDLKECIVAIGDGPACLVSHLSGFKHIVVQNSDEFFPSLQQCHPSLLIVDTVDIPFFTAVRAKAATSSTPIVLVQDTFSSQDADAVLFIPHLIMVHSSVAMQKAFLMRLTSLTAGQEQSIPTMTAALVKGAIIYIDKNVQTQFSRLDLAEAVNASEDYLGRVFRKEMGLPLWEYLHIHRIALATAMLKETPLSITEVANRTGFKDLAYFSRVFKRVKGFAPSQLHTQKREER